MTIYLCFAALIAVCFFIVIFGFKKSNSEDTAAMRRVFGERMKTIYTLTAPEQFEILKQHINADADKFRLLVSPDLVNAKVKWLMDEIDKRTNEIVQIDWLYDFSMYR